MITKNDIKKLKRLHRKRHRQEDGLYLVEGRKCVAEALDAHADIHTIYATADYAAASSSDATQIVICSQRDLQAFSQMTTAPEVIATVRISEPKSTDRPLVGGRLLGLDALRDPGNLGTLIRIADWFGMDRIILSPDCVDRYNHKVIQSTMGGIFRLDIVVADLEEVARQHRESGKSVMVGVMDGADLRQAVRPTEGLLILGNESNGVSPALVALADKRLRIEGSGGAESLNVAVAGGILAYWWCTGLK